MRYIILNFLNGIKLFCDVTLAIFRGGFIVNILLPHYPMTFTCTFIGILLDSLVSGLFATPQTAYQSTEIRQHMWARATNRIPQLVWRADFPQYSVYQNWKNKIMVLEPHKYCTIVMVNKCIYTFLCKQ